MLSRKTFNQYLAWGPSERKVYVKILPILYKIICTKIIARNFFLNCSRSWVVAAAYWPKIFFWIITAVVNGAPTVFFTIFCIFLTFSDHFSLWNHLISWNLSKLINVLSLIRMSWEEKCWKIIRMSWTSIRNTRVARTYKVLFCQSLVGDQFLKAIFWRQKLEYVLKIYCFWELITCTLSCNTF